MNRRRAPRHDAILLTPLERTRHRQQLAKAGSCGSYFASFRRVEASPTGPLEWRLSCRLRCGTHLCATCGAELRKRQAARTEGNWRLFLTFGVPASACSPGRAWRWMSRWLGKFTRELRRPSNRRPGGPVVLSESSVNLVHLTNEVRPMGARKTPDVQYAWALEPHLSGYPHVHLVTNAIKVDYTWARATWSRILGASVKWLAGRRVWDIDGVCRYLAKYISKTQMTGDISAIMYRKRTWASTVQKDEKPDPIWERERDIGPDIAYRSTVDPDAVAAQDGWKVELSRKNEYSLFVRKITLTNEIETQIAMARGREAEEGDPERDRLMTSIAWHIAGDHYGGKMSPDAERLRRAIRRQ